MNIVEKSVKELRRYRFSRRRYSFYEWRRLAGFDSVICINNEEGD